MRYFNITIFHVLFKNINKKISRKIKKRIAFFFNALILGNKNGTLNNPC